MLLDSLAWMEYFMGTHKGEKVKRFVEDNSQLYTSPIVIAEIYSKSLRTDGNAQERTDFIMKRCSYAMIFHRLYKFIFAIILHAPGLRRPHLVPYRLPSCRPVRATCAEPGQAQLA